MRASCSDGMPEPVSATSAIDASPSTRVDDRQPAAARHRVARVEEQVQEHLLQLVLDAEHRHRRRRQLAPHLDAADLELVLEQREHVGDDRVEIDVHPFASPACPGRDRFSRPLTILAARNVCRSIFSSSTRPRIGRIGALEQHLREARDAGQRRVDLVRHAGGEQADRRHLLGNLQLLFELHAVGDVLDDA